MNENADIRPRPDPTALTTQALDREIAHLKELMDKDREASKEAIRVALDEMNRRLAELNELRKAVEQDRSQFVRGDVYYPAFEGLRRQQVLDGERMVAMTGEVKQTSNDIAELKSSLMWLSRLVIGAVVLAVIAIGFRALTGRL